MKQQKTIIALTAVALAACATPPPARWTRVGPAVAQQQLDMDWAVCRGAAHSQSSAIPPRPETSRRNGLGLSNAVDSYAHAKTVTDTHNAVLFGCMADRGWLADNR